MFKVLPALLLSAFLYCSCSKEKELPAGLSTLIKNTTCTCQPYINQYVWKSKTVYVLAFRGPACNWIPAYYNENGEALNMDADYSYVRFLEESDFKKQVWSCGENR